jgi:hypothetical protein
MVVKKTGVGMKLNKMLYTVLLCSTALWAARNMENLDRGLVAVKVGSGVYVGWRVLGTDAASTGFNVYRDGVKVNSAVVTGATNLVDAAGTISSTYTVKAVVGGVEQAMGGTASVWAAQGKAIPLKRPAGGTTPDNVAYTYTPNDMATGDLDGDGQWELVVKWDPSNSKDNSQNGYTGNVFIDAYELNGTRLWRIDLGVNIRAGAHYTQMLVGDYDSDGKAEIALKTAPGTKDGTGAYLGLGSAAGAAHTTDYRNSKGYILSGAEFLTVFNGLTGKEMATINYVPARGTVSSWGDSYGNRVDRFLATNAYLDGTKPSMVFQRGYYTRMAVAAFDWNGTTLSQRWSYNSATSGSGCYGQGHHNLSSADVDSDGKDEIIEGSCAINDDGTFMYRTGLGHGDAMHVGDLLPSRAGLEVFTVHEETSAAYGYEMHDAATGAHIWGVKTGTDNGRGLAADIDSNYAGYEAWSFGSSNVFTSQGVATSNGRPSINFRIYWDGDLQDEILDGTKLDDWTGSGTNRLMSFYNYPTTSNGAVANNTTKATPGLVADLLGDWREEAIFPMSSGDSLVIFTTTTPTTHRLYTLMHDPVYRNAISWQNTAYNQPPHLGFFLGNGVAKAPVPNIKLVGSNNVKINTAPVITSASTFSVAENTASKFVAKITATDAEGDALTYTITGGDDQAQFILGTTSANLYFTKEPNYELPRDADANGSYKLRIQVSDGTLTTTQNLTVTVTNVNEAPSAIALTALSIDENKPSGTLVGLVSAVDPDATATLVYSLVANASGALRLEGNSLLTTASWDYETQTSYDIVLRVTDQDGLPFDQTFTIAVNDVDESISSSSGTGASSSSQTTTLLDAESSSYQTARYQVFDLQGRAQFNYYQRPRQLPQGLWVVRSYNAQGKELQSWVEQGKY